MSRYFKEVDSYPLLSEEEELWLGKRIFEGRYAQTRIDRLYDDVSEVEHPKGSQEEELSRIAEDGRVAQHELACHNLRLVISCARNFKDKNPSLSLPDLVSSGNMGLLKASEKYDYRKGRFSTYATWWVRQSITRDFKDNWDLIRKPVHIHVNKRKLFRAMVECGCESPEDIDGFILEKAGLTWKDAKAALDAPWNRFLYIDHPLGGGDPDGMIPNITDSSPSADHYAERNELIDETDKVLACLSPREEYVLRERLLKPKTKTLQEVGDDMGITRERVRQIEKMALMRLKRLDKRMRLEPHVDFETDYDIQHI